MAKVVVLDACVLYPAPLRDLLLYLAAQGLIIPKWSKKIQDEWVRNLLLNRADILPSSLEKTVAAMNRAFPDAEVRTSKGTVPALPDPGDEHVLRTALASHSTLILTFNLKDFPASILGKVGIQAIHPDAFVLQIIESEPELALLAFRNQVQALKNPPKTDFQVLETLNKNGLPRASGLIASLVQAS